MNPSRCIWLDLETTGLDPFVGCILEIAIVVTDERFNEIARFQRVLNPAHTLGYYGILAEDAWHDLLHLCDDYVRKMHTANGLFDALPRGIAQTDAEYQARDFLVRHGALGAPLCGNSVHFDRKWLEVHMPDLHDDLHYRTFDASSLRVGLVGIGGQWIESPKRGAEHRALADVLSSIELARLALDYGTGWRSLWTHVRAMGRVLRRMLSFGGES